MCNIYIVFKCYIALLIAYFLFFRGKKGKTPMDYITTFQSVVTQQLSHSLIMAKSIHV